MKILKILIALGIVLSMTTSCMKVPKMEEDLGSPVQADEIADKMITSWGNTSLEQVQKDDFLATEKTIKISSLDPRVTLRKGFTVTQLEDVVLEDQTPARYIHMLVQAEEIVDGQQSRLSTREKKLGYRKETASRETNSESTASVNVLSEMSKDLDIRRPTANKVETKDAEDEIQLSPYEMFRGLVFLCGQKGVECFKLESEIVEEAVPEDIAVDANCRGIPNCRWQLTRVQIVAFITAVDPDTNTESKSKAIIKLKISKDLPFLSRLVEYCYEGITTYQSQKFPVSVCHKLKDFRRGTATTP